MRQGVCVGVGGGGTGCGEEILIGVGEQCSRGFLTSYARTLSNTTHIPQGARRLDYRANTPPWSS